MIYSFVVHFAIIINFSIIVIIVIIIITIGMMMMIIITIIIIIVGFFPQSPIDVYPQIVTKIINSKYLDVNNNIFFEWNTDQQNQKMCWYKQVISKNINIIKSLKKEREKL